MNINYKGECDAWTKFLTQSVLKVAKVKQTEFEVFSADDRRIRIHVKVWNENAKPEIIGMMNGAWENHTWVIKFECETDDKYNVTLHYLLFDWEAGKKYEKTVTSGVQLVHIVPKFIHEGAYEISSAKDVVEFSPIVYVYV